MAMGGNIRAQILYNINFTGDQSAQVTPKKTITTVGYNYLLYEMENNASPSNPIIGISKVDRSNLQMQFDVRLDMSNNSDYPYGHNLKAIDIETFLDKIYVLMSISNRDVLLVEMNQSNGSIIKKEIIQVSANNNYFPTFTPTDLFFGYNGDNELDPTISILGYSKNSSSYYDNKVHVLYKRSSASTFNTITFDYSSPISSFNDLKLNYFLNDQIKISFQDNLNIHSLEYSLTTHIESDKIIFFDYNYFIKGLTYFNWDNIGYYFGQLTTDFSGAYNGDVFFFRESDAGSVYPINTYNNPNFLLITGDTHANEDDLSMYGHANGGVASTSAIMFSGLFYDPSDFTHPKIAIGKLDMTYGDNISMLNASVYTLRNLGTSTMLSMNNLNNLKNTFGSAIQSNTGSTGFFYRKPLSISDKNNAYIMNFIPDYSTSCNTIVSFPRHNYYSGNYNYGSPIRTYVQYQFDGILAYENSFLPIDFQIAQNNASLGQISSVCSELMTDGGGDVICDPVLGCYLTPQNDSKVTPTQTNTTLDEAGLNTLSTEVSINPNPFKETFVCSSKELIQTIRILDLTGRIVFSKTDINAKQYRFSNKSLIQGVYAVQIQVKSGKVFTKKVIKIE